MRLQWRPGATIPTDPLATPDRARQVRCGPNYPKYGKKAPSGAALGVVEAIDIFRTERRISHSLALGHIALPPATPGWSETYPEFLVITQVGGRPRAPLGVPGALGRTLLLTPCSLPLTPYPLLLLYCSLLLYSLLPTPRCALLSTTNYALLAECDFPCDRPDMLQP